MFVLVQTLVITGLISYLLSSRTTILVILETLDFCMVMVVPIIVLMTLWDGAGYGIDSTCGQFNNPPWFYFTLPQATKDDVEVRLCFTEAASYKNIVIYLLEIYAEIQ